MIRHLKDLYNLIIDSFRINQGDQYMELLYYFAAFILLVSGIILIGSWLGFIGALLIVAAIITFIGGIVTR